MKYDHSRAGLRLKPSAEGLVFFSKMLTSETRATLVGIDVYEGNLIRLQRDGKPIETWGRRYWIPLRGNRQWRRPRP